MKLDIGCGEMPREGYEGVDIQTTVGATHCFDLTETWPLEDNSVEAIQASHVLEHFPDPEVVHILTEANRVLQPQGLLEIVVPNLPEVLRMFLDMEDFKQKWMWGLKTIFGQNTDKYQIHRTGFDNEKLILFMEELGFGGVVCEEVWTHSQPSLLARGYKNENAIRQAD